MLLEREYASTFAKHIGTIKPDVVICANTPSFVVARASTYCASAGIRYVSWVQDLYGVAAYRILKRKFPILGAWVGKYLMHLDRKALGSSHAVICITEDFIPFVSSAGVVGDKIHILHNWAPLEEVPERPRDNNWTKKVGLKPGVRFLYAGTLAMKHNPNLLLQLALAMSQWGPGELNVVSQGPGADWLRAQAVQRSLTNINIFDYQPFETLPDVLGSADVTTAILEPDAGAFSVPSKILSYLCAARPILAAMPAENLAARTVKLANAGFVTAPDDIDGWLQNAKSLYHDTELRRTMGCAARRYATDEFDSTKISHQFSRIISP